jgi:hypothetical protein
VGGVSGLGPVCILLPAMSSFSSSSSSSKFLTGTLPSYLLMLLLLLLYSFTSGLPLLQPHLRKKDNGFGIPSPGDYQFRTVCLVRQVLEHRYQIGCRDVMQ